MASSLVFYLKIPIPSPRKRIGERTKEEEHHEILGNYGENFRGNKIIKPVQ